MSVFGLEAAATGDERIVLVPQITAAATAVVLVGSPVASTTAMVLVPTGSILRTLPVRTRDIEECLLRVPSPVLHIHVQGSGTSGAHRAHAAAVAAGWSVTDVAPTPESPPGMRGWRGEGFLCADHDGNTFEVTATTKEGS
jgi:hypothetical protein